MKVNFGSKSAAQAMAGARGWTLQATLTSGADTIYSYRSSRGALGILFPTLKGKWKFAKAE